MRQHTSLLIRPSPGHNASCRLRAATTTLLVLLATLFVATPVHADAIAADTNNKPLASYRLGIFPYMAPRQTVEFFGPVASIMGEALNHSVKLESVPGFSDFTDAMMRETYDIALIQPFDYPDVVENHGYIPLAQLSVPLVSQFFVRSDSRFQKIEDLRGTTIAMPPSESASARLTLHALYANNLIPGRDVELRYFNSHDSCIQQVWIGKASTCGTARPPIAVFEKRMHASLRPIYSTPSIPHVMFVAHPRVPAVQRAKLQALMIGWTQTEKGRAILKSLGFPGFVAPRPAEYTMMRDYDPIASMPRAQTRATQDLILGVFPFLTPRQLAKNVAPILPALRKLANTKAQLRTATSFGKFMDGVASGSYDVILVQPFEYARATRSGYLPLAGMKDNLQGTFYVRTQSRFRKVDDFKGQLIAMPPPDSAQARLGRQALTHAGLTPGRDVTINYRPTHDSCLREVQQGKAAACVSSTIVLKIVPKELTRDLRTVGQTDKVPGVLFLAHKRLPAKLRDQLQTEIVSWKDTNEGRKILKSLGFGDFAIINPDDYQKLAHFEEQR
jgi:phosphonate transport system substrate-binding protein